MIMRIPRLLLVLPLLICASVPVASGQMRYFTEDHRVYQNFHSKFLPKDRDVIVLLPQGYRDNPTKRYPVLYMHDGRRVFTVWRLDETANALVSNKQIEPLIIVCVDNGGTSEDRTSEYTPTRDEQRGRGGNADQYGRMLVEELKPVIDAEFRTLTDAANTGLGGASLGGLVTLYLGLKYPNVFGRLAVMSPSVGWDKGFILKEVKGLTKKPPLRIWLDIGTREGPITGVKALRDALMGKGWFLDSDLAYLEAEGAEHTDEAFGRRASRVVKFLFPALSKTKVKS
ncbi:MAG TPA: alpha/beta hydrolase-fold protein [Pyrinomonadaceae bacterium]|nr:alpha/beta hydrolase-fold protein [Pyrinomonadaceae bacterium]